MITDPMLDDRMALVGTAAKQSDFDGEVWAVGTPSPFGEGLPLSDFAGAGLVSMASASRKSAGVALSAVRQSGRALGTFSFRKQREMTRHAADTPPLAVVVKHRAAPWCWDGPDGWRHAGEPVAEPVVGGPMSACTTGVEGIGRQRYVMRGGAVCPWDSPGAAPVQSRAGSDCRLIRRNGVHLLNRIAAPQVTSADAGGVYGW